MYCYMIPNATVSRRD